MNTHPTQSRCSSATAIDRTRLLIGCYRKGECEDPEVYVAAVAAVLAHFPEDVAKTVTDPIRGLPGSLKWLPTVAEVKAACDEEMRPRLDAYAREHRQREASYLLAAPEPDDQEKRDRAFDHYEREVRPLLRPKTFDRAGKENAQAQLEAIQAGPKPVLKLSPAALASARRADASAA